MITFGIVLGSVSLALIAADSAFEMLGRREERRMLRSANARLTQENLTLRSRVELLDARVKSKQYTADVIKQTQIDDLQSENRRLRTLLDQKWEGATHGQSIDA